MAAMIGPVGIQHTDLCHRRISFFFVFKIFLYKDEIFKYIIIKTEHDTRDNQNFEKAVNTKSNVSWDSNKTQYVHYEKAIQSFNKKGNTYDNGTYVIKILKNRIITKYKENK